MDLTSSLEAKFGARSGQVHKIRGKIWEVLSPKTQKLGKSPNVGVISEIQRAKFGVFVIYIFGGKIWGSNKNFRGKIGAKPPSDLLIWKYPLGSLVCVRLLFSFPPFCQGLRTGALLDSGRTKVAKEEQRIWLFSQSNHSIDLNQLISAKRGNSSSSFCDKENIYSTSSELESKDRSNRTAKAGTEEK